MRMKLDNILKGRIRLRNHRSSRYEVSREVKCIGTAKSPAEARGEEKLLVTSKTGFQWCSKLWRVWDGIRIVNWTHKMASIADIRCKLTQWKKIQASWPFSVDSWQQLISVTKVQRNAAWL